MGLSVDVRLAFAVYASLVVTAQAGQADTLIPPPNMVPCVPQSERESNKPAYLLAPANTALISPNASDGAVSAGPINVSQMSIAAIAYKNAIADPVMMRLDSLLDPDWQCQPTRVLFSTSSGIVTAAGTPVSVPMLQQPALIQEFGCNYILSKTFERTQRAVTILVYTFADSASAFGAYSTMRTGASNVVIRGDASSEDEKSVSFCRGRRFIVLVGVNDDDEVSKRLVSRFADELSQTIDNPAARPALVVSLPPLDRLAGSERFFMGPVGTRKHIAIPFVRTLELEKSGGVAFAEYQFPKPLAERMKVILIDYKDPQLARKIYTAYSAGLATAHKIQLAQPNMQVVKIADSYMLCGINNSRVTIIAGARRKVSTLVLARQFAY